MITAAAPSTVLDLVGNTPLIRLQRIAREAPDVEILAKAEWTNPGGSVKDRPALNMVIEAEGRGELTPGKRILDATSGNTGIALAMIGAARGYAVTLCLPANASEERRRILRAYGVELVLTSPLEMTDGAQREARRLHIENPDRYWYADQYGNDDNWRAHYKSTAEEIWRQTEGRVTHWVAGLGTSGTFTGVTRRLRELKPSVECISFQPATPLHGLDGLKHMPTSLTPGIYDPALADRDLAVHTEAAEEMVVRLAREEGLLVGPSSGAALSAALQVAREIGRGVIVTLFPDGADKYLSLPFWIS